jgi:hypothetical protein
MSNREVETELVERQREITMIILLHHLTNRFTAIEEAVTSLCGTVEVLAGGLKVLAEELNKEGL